MHSCLLDTFFYELILKQILLLLNKFLAHDRSLLCFGNLSKNNIWLDLYLSNRSKSLFIQIWTVTSAFLRKSWFIFQFTSIISVGVSSPNAKRIQLAFKTVPRLPQEEIFGLFLAYLVMMYQKITLKKLI